MLNIALDLDGVLVDSLGKFVEIWNKIKDDNKTINDITRFGFYTDWGMSEAVFWTFFDLCKTQKLDALDLKAPKYVKKLFKKHHIDIVTARKESERGLVEETLKNIGIFQGEHYRDLVITPRIEHSPKIEYDYDIYIDDNPNLAKDVQDIQQFEDRVLLMWVQPWNWMIESGNGVYRVNNWKDIMNWFANNNLYI